VTKVVPGSAALLPLLEDSVQAKLQRGNAAKSTISMRDTDMIPSLRVCRVWVHGKLQHPFVTMHLYTMRNL
jgi:hypothetical protein